MSSTNQSQLAIIIPYYKNRYILGTLRALERQTNQNFRVYIGDDHSPNPIQEAINALSDSFQKQITYHKFSDNLGAASLTKQWERCVNLSVNEPYIWLFSDDDLMPDDAVQRFYEFIKENGSKDLIRFNIQIINDDDEITKKSKPHPAFETAESFLNRRLTGKCISSACEYIFSRKVYQEKNGFIDFPLAWTSDDATWINYADNGIYTIPGSPVSWRMGGYNISSDKSGSYKSKITSCILFLKLVEKKYKINPLTKLNWLFGHLSLLQKSNKVKIYFYKQVFNSGLFDKTFVAKQAIARNMDILTTKINNVTKRTARKLGYKM